MNRYSSYSKSPLEWMGKIPSHWFYTKNRFGFKKWKNGKNESDETPVLSLTTKGIKIKKDLSFGKSTESYIGHQLVEKGDIVFTPRDFDQTPILSDVSKYNGCISNLYIVDKTNERILNHYINYYWYGLKYSVDYFKNFSHGMRFSFNRFQFDEIPLLIPPFSEQTQIVSFLDTKTQKIDELIEKTEQKIELLKEKRTSFINHCVTKGLNPNVEMKDSGVEWIGKIPSGWVISRLDFLCLLYGRLGWKSLKSDEYVDEGYVFLSTPNIKNREIDYRNVNYITEERYFESPEIILENGDVLLVKDGSTLGIVNIVKNLPKPSTVNSSIGVLKNNSDLLSPNFLYYFLSSHYCQNIINRIKGGMGVPHLFQSDIKKFIVLLPNNKEQTKIVEYLDKQTKKIDSTIEKETQRIELLKEYRQSLISEVVTGKIDVRDEAMS